MEGDPKGDMTISELQLDICMSLGRVTLDFFAAHGSPSSHLI